MTQEGVPCPTTVSRFREDENADPPGRRSTPLLIRQWKYLWRDESVELRHGLEVIGTGQVDDVTADGTTIWVHLSGGRGRVMIHHTDGTDIWRIESRITQNRGTPGRVRS